ncbi:LytR/AlgR family response regulator transcription factor [Paenibacillus bouchesdurhonensis]|uniref:LytR/AlgR family response regulator transcription factor n=1 Tax=Paenibacillus bouchesdurhonensis TaxID=1870990 RepID=UPI000DA60736|nr:LytTR family DNA-binding domain-containing protein [Paenibacillus bouchesdurhonensis]
MIRIAICSNNENILNQTEEKLNDYFKKCDLSFEIQRFVDPISLLDEMDKDFQIFFLDSEMPLVKNRRVIHSIRKIDKYAYLIFLASGHFKYDPGRPGYFFSKTNKSNLFEKEMERALRHVQRIKNKYMVIKNHDGYFKIYLSAIYYLETYNRNILIHTENGDFLCFKKMQELEEELGSISFIRCHKSYIVNMDYIRKIGVFEIELENKDRVFISRWRRKEVIERLSQYIENV